VNAAAGPHASHTYAASWVVAGAAAALISPCWFAVSRGRVSRSRRSCVDVRCRPSSYTAHARLNRLVESCRAVWIGRWSSSSSSSAGARCHGAARLTVARRRRRCHRPTRTTVNSSTNDHLGYSSTSSLSRACHFPPLRRRHIAVLV